MSGSVTGMRLDVKNDVRNYDAFSYPSLLIMRRIVI